mgnify:CR=1 FL=1
MQVFQKMFFFFCRVKSKVLIAVVHQIVGYVVVGEQRVTLVDLMVDELADVKQFVVIVDVCGNLVQFFVERRSDC